MRLTIGDQLESPRDRAAARRARAGGRRCAAPRAAWRGPSARRWRPSGAARAAARGRARSDAGTARRAGRPRSSPRRITGVGSACQYEAPPTGIRAPPVRHTATGNSQSRRRRLDGAGRPSAGTARSRSAGRVVLARVVGEALVSEHPVGPVLRRRRDRERRGAVADRRSVRSAARSWRGRRAGRRRTPPGSARAPAGGRRRGSRSRGRPRRSGSSSSGWARAAIPSTKNVARASSSSSSASSASVWRASAGPASRQFDAPTRRRTS